MKFARHPTGFTGPGNSTANFLGRSGNVWERKRNGNALAINKGGLLETRIEEAAIDGYFSLGTVAGVPHIVTSATARGRFRDLGAAPEGYSLFDFGRGLAASGQFGTPFYVNNFDSRPVINYPFTMRLTSNGRVFRDHYGFIVTMPFDGVGGFLGKVSTVRGAWTLDTAAPVPGRYKFTAGSAFISLDEAGQMRPVFAVDSVTSQEVGATIWEPDQLALYPEVSRLNPHAVLMMNKYIRTYYSRFPSSLVDDAACAGVFFTLSLNGGRTWARVSSEAIISEFVTTKLQSIPNTWFNAYVDSTVLSVAPLSASRALLYMIVPYATGGSPETNFRAKVKLGIIDLNAGGSMLETLVLLDDSLANAQTFHGGAAAKLGTATATLAVRGGALVFSNPLRAEHDEWNQRRRVQFTPDGVNLVDVGFMPLPNYQTGDVSALSPDLLICPMFDGEYSLYQSKDRGATWSKRAVISKDGDPPTSTSFPLALQQFRSIVALRIGGNVANATPGAPWVSDARVAAPA